MIKRVIVVLQAGFVTDACMYYTQRACRTCSDFLESMSDMLRYNRGFVSEKLTSRHSMDKPLWQEETGQQDTAWGEKHLKACQTNRKSARQRWLSNNIVWIVRHSVLSHTGYSQTPHWRLSDKMDCQTIHWELSGTMEFQTHWIVRQHS